MDTSPSSIPSIELTDPAGFWIRLGGHIIDSILLLATAFVVCLAFGFPTVLELLSSESGAAVAGAYSTATLTVVLGVLYQALFESSRWQATVGKKVLGLTVTNMDGERIGLGRAIARNIPKILIVILIPIAMVVVGLNARKKGIHDFIADTRVFKSGD